MNNDDKKAPEAEAVEQPKTTHGGRNLMIMGFVALVIAFITTATSLFIYRQTGDVYLDRSRPGYIFEDEKHDAADDKKDVFSADGEITAEVLDGYLRELDDAMTRIDDSSDDFSLEPLSDDALTINNQIEDED